MSKVGSACWRYEPFTNVDSGRIPSEPSRGDGMWGGALCGLFCFVCVEGVPVFCVGACSAFVNMPQGWCLEMFLRKKKRKKSMIVLRAIVG